MRSLPESQTVQKASRRVIARRLRQLREAKSHPAYLLEHVECVDNTTGETFKFQLVNPDAPWFWQRDLLDSWIANSKSIALKARQIGVTWLAAGYALWTLLYVPGSKVLVVSITESEAVKVINRVWDMYLSLPEHLRNKTRVIKPLNARPNKQIQMQHTDGRISTIIGLPSTPTAGHGETAALIILDEFSRQEYAAETWKACLPTTQKAGGRALIISTGNGVSNDRGGGNFFHHLWATGDTYGIHKRFLPWDLHPDRDEDWYERHAAALPSADRGEQYPRNEREAFILTGKPYFDVEALTFYSDRVPTPLYRFDFQEAERSTTKGVQLGGRKVRSEHGNIRVYQEPVEGGHYAVGADVATGRGYDFSAAYVIDLAEMQIVAEFHAKLDADLYAEQLHYLGRWYNSALLAVEVGGGYGDAVLIPLRDGRAGRPTYPKIYKHLMSNRPDMPTARTFGFPMNTKTRPLVISQLEQAIRERSLPFLTSHLLGEAQTFVHAESNPTPRGQDGCNDDCVMAAAITLEMYRLRGAHPKLEQRRKVQAQGRKRKHETMYPWLPPDTSVRDKAFDQRYPREGASA